MPYMPDAEPTSASLQQEFVRTATSQGLRERWWLRHALGYVVPPDCPSDLFGALLSEPFSRSRTYFATFGPMGGWPSSRLCRDLP